MRLVMRTPELYDDEVLRQLQGPANRQSLLHLLRRTEIDELQEPWNEDIVMVRLQLIALFSFLCCKFSAAQGTSWTPSLTHGLMQYAPRP